ncbi:MAG: hypothetical protein V3V12_02500 [Gammaproteobacteria bacterium]
MNGGDLGDMARAGILASVTAGMLNGVGDALGAVGMFDPSMMLSHGVVGGINNGIMGGDFKAGFLSGAFTAGIAPGVGNIGNKAG